MSHHCEMVEMRTKDPDSPKTMADDRPQKIAFCITDLDPGGAERALFEIVKRLDKRRWEPHVFSLTSGDVAKWLTDRDIPVKCFDSTGKSWFSVFGWLTGELRRLAPEIVQGFLFHGNLVSRIAGWRAGVPIRVAGHRVAEREKRWHLWVERLTKRLVTHHVCVSRGVAEYLMQNCGIRESAITVIPNGIDPDVKIHPDGRLQSELGVSPETQIVLGVGRLHRQKGFRDLIEAFSGLDHQRIDAHLAIVGEGPERSPLEAQIQKSTWGDKITLLGYRADVPELIAEADVFVLSSLWEGMPNVVLQAMLLGTPIVSTDVEGIEELMTHEENGLIVEREDQADLRNNLQRLLENRALQTIFSEKSQALVKKEFTWNLASHKYDSLYSDLLGVAERSI